MAEYFRSVIEQNVSKTAGTIYDYILPVRPISHLVLTLKFLQTTVNTVASLSNVLDIIDSIKVQFKGVTVMDLSGRDLYVLNSILFGKEAHQENIDSSAANAVRALPLIIPFGRKLYNPDECFGATAPGDLRMLITTSAAFTNLGSVAFQIEAVELPGATPTKRIKTYTLKKDMTIGSERELDLQIGNVYEGIILYSPTVPVAAASAITIKKVKLLADREERYIGASNWESLKAELINRIGPAGAYSDKRHHYIGLTAPATGFTDIEEQRLSSLARYGLIDFNPAKDDKFLFNSAGLASLKMIMEIGVAQEIRAIPIEVVGK